MSKAGKFNKVNCVPVLLIEKGWLGFEKRVQMYQIQGQLTYDWQIDGVDYRLTLPDGFTFDGASIPTWAIWLSDILFFTDTIEHYGTHWPAAACHDLGFMYRGRLPEGALTKKVNGEWVDAAYGDDGKPLFGFKEWNKLFARQLRELGIGKGTRRAMYLAVASPAGWLSWITGKVPDNARPKRL